MLHQSNFDFNDDLIAIGAEFWWEIAKDRLLIWITFTTFIVNLMNFLILRINQQQVKEFNQNCIILDKRLNNTKKWFLIHITIEQHLQKNFHIRLSDNLRDRTQ